MEGLSGMPINFHDEKNRHSYANRRADEGWKNAVFTFFDPQGSIVADVGCGGGIYSHAWLELGARSVIGLDSSKVLVENAREHGAGVSNLSFHLGEACATGLADESVDVVFERALIHHLKDLAPAVAEAYRIVAPSGRIIIQDRIPEDVGLPGSPDHIRGYFFERFPKLLTMEQNRRWRSKTVISVLAQVGFQNIREQTFWETRKRFENFDDLANDLRNRTGRSILHELDDVELEDLMDFIESKISASKPFVERDRWTSYTSLTTHFIS